MTVTGKGLAINAFVAAQLDKRVPRKLTVSHRGNEVVATFALAGYRGKDVVEMTRQALANDLSYTVSGLVIHG
jgi:sulfopyruvate decarboxylase TPP-binding subunit